MIRVDGCGVVRLREGWFILTKGVAYGHVDDSEGTHMVDYGRTSLDESRNRKGYINNYETTNLLDWPKYFIFSKVFD